MSETLASKNSLIEKLQQQLNDHKRLYLVFLFLNLTFFFLYLESENEELARLRREYETLKNNQS
jgi:hypothetical protein